MIAVTSLAGTSLLVWRERLEIDWLSLRALGAKKSTYNKDLISFECRQVAYRSKLP